MLIFSLGLISGILLAFVSIFLALSFGPSDKAELDKSFRKIKNKISHEKAEFFSPGSTEEDALESLYEDHASKGIDTPL